MTKITHIVLFQFFNHIENDTVDNVIKQVFQLKDKCVHPVSGQPYILSLKGGCNNSVEGLNDGITHAFVMEFANEEDRNYYALKDPDHLEFIRNVKGIASKVTVIDF